MIEARGLMQIRRWDVTGLKFNFIREPSVRQESVGLKGAAGRKDGALLGRSRRL
jgi:hypothetical protein